MVRPWCTCKCLEAYDIHGILCTDRLLFLSLIIHPLSPDVPSYVYMNKRLKTDAAGIPHRSLDSYRPYSTRAQALKAPYDSFTSYESTAPPTSTPPKPPRSYSSSGNQPRGTFNNTNVGSSQRQRDTDFHGSQSSNSSNIPRDNAHYNNSTGSHCDNQNVSSFHIRITAPQEPRGTPPSPPSRTGPNSSPCSGSYGVNGNESSHSHYSTNEVSATLYMYMHVQLYITLHSEISRTFRCLQSQTCNTFYELALVVFIFSIAIASFPKHFMYICGLIGTSWLSQELPSSF